MDPLSMLAALIVALLAAGIIAAVKLGRAKFRSRSSAVPPAEDFPVRLTCRDETEFHPGSGYHEALHFEVFNHSDKPVRIKGFGLKLSMSGPGADWFEYEQARQHPRIEFPALLQPNDGLEGYVEHESLGDELHERGLAGYLGESTPYVDVVGFGERTVATTAAVAG